MRKDYEKAFNLTRWAVGNMTEFLYNGIGTYTMKSVLQYKMPIFKMIQNYDDQGTYDPRNK